MHAIIPWQRLAVAVMELSAPLLILSYLRCYPLSIQPIFVLSFSLFPLVHSIERTPLLAFLQQVPPGPRHRRLLLLPLRLRHSQHRTPFIPLFPRKTAPSCSTWFLRSTPSTSKSPSTRRTFPSPFPFSPVPLHRPDPRHHLPNPPRSSLHPLRRRFPRFPLFPSSSIATSSRGTFSSRPPATSRYTKTQFH